MTPRDQLTTQDTIKAQFQEFSQDQIVSTIQKMGASSFKYDELTNQFQTVVESTIAELLLHTNQNHTLALLSS